MPIWTPAAPMTRAAARPLPSAKPPATTTGISISGRTWVIRARVVSFPMWPPASRPSIIRPSAPLPSTLFASLRLGTTARTLVPTSLIGSM